MKLVTFKDSSDIYSQSAEKDFVSQFRDDRYSNHLVDQEDINGTKSLDELSAKVRATVNRYHPDVILFTPLKINQMVAFLNATPPSIQVVMGSAGYEVIESDTPAAGYNRIRFSSGAFADEWHEYGEQPAFF